MPRPCVAARSSRVAWWPPNNRMVSSQACDRAARDTLALDARTERGLAGGMPANGGSGWRDPQAFVARVQPHDEWH